MKSKDRNNREYLLTQQRLEVMNLLFETLEIRIGVANTCLVNIRNLSRTISKKVDIGPRKLSKIIDSIMVFIRAKEWGHACSDYRLEKWNVRPLASKIYQVDRATLNSLKQYKNQSWHFTLISMESSLEGGENQ